jgi:hypothetical protein
MKCRDLKLQKSVRLAFSPYIVANNFASTTSEEHGVTKELPVISNELSSI